jgi:hypothetical protein
VPLEGETEGAGSSEVDVLTLHEAPRLTAFDPRQERIVERYFRRADLEEVAEVIRSGAQMLANFGESAKLESASLSFPDHRSGCRALAGK